MPQRTARTSLAASEHGLFMRPHLHTRTAMSAGATRAGPPNLRTLDQSGEVDVIYHVTDDCPEYAPEAPIGLSGDFPQIVTAAWPKDEYLKLANDRSALCPRCIPSLDRLMPQGGLD